MGDYYKISRDGTQGEICIFGEIYEKSWAWWDDQDFSLTGFYKDFKKLDGCENVDVLVNSVGGDVFAATSVAELLRAASAHIRVKIVGLCASAATLLLGSTDETEITAGGVVMIHDPSTFLFGQRDAPALRKVADRLDKVRDAIAKNLALACGKDEETVKKDMAAETWMTSDEAVEYGLVKKITDADGAPGGMPAVNLAPIMNSIPDKMRDRFDNGLFFYTENPENTEERKSGTMDVSEIKTVDDLKKALPELCGQIESESAKNAAETATKAERARLAALDEIAIPGYEDLIEKAKNEGRSPADAAFEIAKAVKERDAKKGADELAAREAAAKRAGTSDVAASAGNDAGAGEKSEEQKALDEAIKFLNETKE